MAGLTTCPCGHVVADVFTVEGEWANALPIDQAHALSDDSCVFGFLTADDIHRTMLMCADSGDRAALADVWLALQRLHGRSEDKLAATIKLEFSEAMTAPLLKMLKRHLDSRSSTNDTAADNPFTYTGVRVAGEHVRFNLKNASTNSIPRFGCAEQPIRIGIRGRAKNGSGDLVHIAVDRVLVIPPMLPRSQATAAYKLFVTSDAIENGECLELPFARLRLIGDADFLSTCFLESHTLQEYIKEPSQYERYVLCASLSAAIDVTQQLRSEVQGLVDASLKKCGDFERIRHSLQGMGLPKNRAVQDATEITSRTGKRVLNQLDQLFSGEKLPLERALAVAAARRSFAKAVAPATLSYASSTFAESYYLVAVDAECAYLCQASTELRLHAALLEALGWQRPLNAMEHSAGLGRKAAVTWNELRQEILEAKATDWRSWHQAEHLLSRLPEVPERPTEPQDPYVAAALAARAQVIAQQHAAQEATRTAGMQSLERDAVRAQARGDVEGFMEAQAAIGAAAAAETGDSRLTGLYGSQATARAQLATGAGGPLPSLGPLEVSRPEDYETRPEWTSYLQQRQQYSSQLEAYELASKAYTTRVDEIAAQLRPAFEKKKAQAIRELERLEPMDIAREKIRERYDRGNRAVGELENSATFLWLIPSILPFVDIANESVEEDSRLRIVGAGLPN